MVSSTPFPTPSSPLMSASTKNISSQSMETDKQIYTPTIDSNPVYTAVKFSFKTTAIFVSLAFLSVLLVNQSKSMYEVSSSKESSTSSFVSKARGDGSGRVTYSLLDDDQKELLFQDFITTYGKTYSEGSDEYNERLLNFKSNLDTADDRNAKESAAGGSGNHGVTKFADLTSGEFLASYLMTENAESRERRLAAIAQAKNIKQSTTSLRSNSNGRLLQSDPTIIFVDWSDSITTEIKNMGKCGGGSWASAAVSQVESDSIKEGIIKVTDPLSVQQILSCTPDQSGCDNGEMQDAFNSIIKPGGIYYNSEYAYTSYAGSVDECVATDSQYALAIGSAFNLNSDNIASNTEALMRMHLTSTGTLAVW